MLHGVFANAPLPGEILAEKYRVERILGSGGMGVVYAATHVHLHERYALKLLRRSAMSDPINVERFMREGRAAVKIRSEHVARVFDVGTLDDGTPYMVLEYLEGSDFAELLEIKGQLTVADAVDYVLQACEAIAEAHAAKIVHRDLKPSNLFLAGQEEGPPIVKVLDFGISKMATLEPGLAMTQTSAIIGSPLYMSPEQLKSARDVDERSDIWSIGVLLYQMIAGRPPFLTESLPELCALVLSGHVPWLEDVVVEAPSALGAVIATCLRPAPADRYVNLADFADAVASFGGAGARSSADRVVATLGMPARRAATYTRPIARRPRRSRWLIGASFAALATAAVGGGLVGRRPADAAPSRGVDRSAPIETSAAAPSALAAMPPEALPSAPADRSAPSNGRDEVAAPAPKPIPIRSARGPKVAPPEGSAAAPSAVIAAPATPVPRSPLGAATSPRD